MHRGGTLHVLKVLNPAAGRGIVMFSKQRREVNSGPSLRKAVLCCSDLGLGNSSLGPCGS